MMKLQVTSPVGGLYQNKTRYHSNTTALEQPKRDFSRDEFMWKDAV
jgi:hypothetical protein